MNPRRRAILAGGLWLPAAALAQHQGAHHGPLYEQLRQPGRIDKPELAAIQNVFDSPAPKAANPGRWTARTPLPLPRGANHVGVEFMDGRPADRFRAWRSAACCTRSTSPAAAR
jgi:hypothetical protein